MSLSEKQIARIQYESMLLKLSPQSVQVIAPWLFIEGVTAANTEVIEPSFPLETKEEIKPTEESNEIAPSGDTEWMEYLGWGS